MSISQRPQQRAKSESVLSDSFERLGLRGKPQRTHIIITAGTSPPDIAERLYLQRNRSWAVLINDGFVLHYLSLFVIEWWNSWRKDRCFSNIFQIKRWKCSVFNISTFINIIMAVTPPVQSGTLAPLCCCFLRWEYNPPSPDGNPQKGVLNYTNYRTFW